MEDSLIGDIDILDIEAFLDPFWQFLVLSRSGEAAVSEYHESVIILATHDSAKTLGALPHRIELEELIPVYDLLPLYHEANALQ